MNIRQMQVRETRAAATEMSVARRPGRPRSNGDELRFRTPEGSPTYIGNFTKCLPHDRAGFLLDPTDYTEWVRSVGTADPRDIRRIRIGPGPFEPDGGFVHDGTGPQYDWAAVYPPGAVPEVRAWESQGAGSTFDLEGPDAQSLTMPPHPSMDSQELIAEMAELHWMAVCRDRPFAQWVDDPVIAAAGASLSRFWWFRADRSDRLRGSTDGLATSAARRRVLTYDGSGRVPLATLFRGVTPGTDVGPYLSQFLIIGNTGINASDDANTPADGMVAFGSLRLDQRVRVATPGRDYLTSWPEFLDVQNGADTRGRETYLAGADGHRFIATPRDLATYVHYDALYEAYLNACLLMLGLGVPADPNLPFRLADWRDKQEGFAQFGAPHILTLVTEVATRALKAVRYQKFNVHRRLRPEAVAGWLYQRRNGDAPTVSKLKVLERMEAAYAGSSGIGAALDEMSGPDNWLLPMAFPEGSPAHPSYGAGHAAVAGACVTILKAWFDHGWELRHDGAAIVLEPSADGSALIDRSASLDAALTVEGELNKLAANIAIGRNWAGVHYYSDYIESFRLGEDVAIGLLEEQKVTYGEDFSFTVPLHDGTTVQI